MYHFLYVNHTSIKWFKKNNNNNKGLWNTLIRQYKHHQGVAEAAYLITRPDLGPDMGKPTLGTTKWEFITTHSTKLPQRNPVDTPKLHITWKKKKKKKLLQFWRKLLKSDCVYVPICVHLLFFQIFSCKINKFFLSYFPIIPQFHFFYQVLSSLLLPCPPVNIGLAKPRDYLIFIQKGWWPFAGDLHFLPRNLNNFCFQS